MEYDLNKFIKSNQQKEEIIIKLGEQKFKIKRNAFSYLKLVNIEEKYRNDNYNLCKEIIKTFLNEEAFKIIKNQSREVLEKVITIITSSIIFTDEENRKLSKKNNNQKKKNQKK